MRRVFAIIVSVLLGTVLVTAAAGAAEAATKGPCCGTTMLINKYKGTSSTPTTTKAPGQINVVSGKLANDRGTIFGTYSSVQTVLSVATGGTYEILNTTIYKLPKGTLTTSGPEVWAPGNRLVNTAPQNLAITGGTGLYAGSAGTATSVPNPQSIEVTFTFTNK